jgi:hypothetical protein
MILKITQKDIDKSKPPSDGWHLFEIEKFSSEDSKDKKSTNMVFDLRCLDKDDNENRYGYARFNSKAVGMMITSGFLPSALDMPIDAELEFNPEEMIGKTLYGNVKSSVYEGKPQKKTEEFAPATKPPF